MGFLNNDELYFFWFVFNERNARQKVELDASDNHRVASITNKSSNSVSNLYTRKTLKIHPCKRKEAIEEKLSDI